MRTAIHCSYHKCLTVFFQRVALGVLRGPVRGTTGGYRHFNSNLELFSEECGQYRIASVNNHALDLDSFGADVRISRFIRDPRDLVVSGYHYHRRGAEEWCRLPFDEAAPIGFNSRPSELRSGESLMELLQRLPEADGFVAEMELRQEHFTSMLKWPKDERVLLLRYEDIVGNEAAAMAAIFRHYGFALPVRLLARRQAVANSSARLRSTKGIRLQGHIRDSAAGQWKSAFTPRTHAEFNRRFHDLAFRLGYNREPGTS